MNNDKQIKQEELKKFALEDEALEDITGGLTPELPESVKKITDSIYIDVVATSNI